MSRRAVFLFAVLLAVAASAPSLASAASAPPRYQFHVHETLTYKLVSYSSATTRIGAAPMTTTQGTSVGAVYYDFGSPRADGAYALGIRTDHRTKATRDGRPVAPLKRDQSSYFWQKTDGTQIVPGTSVAGAYSNGDLGLLPSSPVALGAHWTSTLTDQGFTSPAGLPCVSTLTSVSHLHGDSVDSIKTVCRAQGKIDRTTNGASYHLSGTIVLSGTWTFDTTAGRFLTQTLDQTTALSGTIERSQRVQSFAEHDAQHIVQTFLGVLTPSGTFT